MSVGDQVAFERPSGTWTLSGIDRVRDSYDTDAIVIPGFDRSRIAEGYDQTVVLYDLPVDMSVADTQQLAAELGGVTRYADPYDGFSSGVGRGMAWGWVAGVLALVAVGIIVAAAFATSARRQLVTIGQLTANGATPSVVRRTLALQGTWTGVVGSIVGIGAGLVALPIVKPIVAQHILRHDVAPLRFSVADLVVIALTATVAGTVAAAVPARSASRIPVMSALAGRRPLGELPSWLVKVGLVLLGAGLGLTAVASVGINGSATSNSDDVWALMIVLGVVGVVLGMCCATPLLIERIGLLGKRASLSWRLALRSLARSRTRSSAVVAAIAVAVGGSVAAGAIVETAIRENASNWSATLPDDTIVFDAHTYQDGTYGPDELATVLDMDALPPAPLPDDIRRQVLDIVPGATFVPLHQATVDPEPYDTVTGDGVWPEPNGPRIADPALLEVLDLAPVDVRTLQQVGSLRPVSRWELTHPDEFGLISYQYSGPNGIISLEPPTASVAYRYEYAGRSSPLVTEAYARELGFDIVERGTLVRVPAALTIDQRDDLATLQQDLAGQTVDAFVEPGDPPRLAPGQGGTGEPEWSVSYDEPRYRLVDDTDLWVGRLVILGAVVLLTLLVVAIGLSLAAAEGRDERNVLTVVGATPASMRRQASARAAVLALSGIVLGIPTGFLPVWVVYRVLSTDRSFSTELLRFPWLVTAALIVVVPLLVAGVAWLGSGVAQRFRPPTAARQD